MLKKIGFTIAAIFIVFLTAVLPVLATPSVWNYYFVINVQDTSGVTRTNVPVLTGVSGNALNSSGYMSANGLDAQAADGTSSSLGYMVGSANFPVVIDTLPANGTVPVWLYTGVSPAATSFPFVVGDGGFVTVTDNAALEPANNFSIVASGYLNTTAGASENIVSKTVALVVNVDPSTSGKIDASTYNSATSATSTTVGAGSYTGLSKTGAATNWQANQTNDGDSSYTTLSGNVGDNQTDSYAMTTITTNSTIVSVIAHMEIEFLTNDNGQSAATAIVTHGTPYYGTTQSFVPYDSGYYDYSTTYTTNPSTGLAWTPAEVNAMQIGVKETVGYAAVRCTQVYAVVNYIPTNTVSVSGISSGVHTITVSETTAAGGTLSLQVDSGTPSTVTGVGSVPDTANNWIIDQNNVMPYVTSYVETVSGVEKLKFQPNTIVPGTTLVDRDGTQNGVITFGANSGITITYGGIVSQVTNGATAGGSGLSGFNVSPAGAPQSLLSNGSNLTGAYGNNSTIWGVVASFMGSVQTAGQIPPQSQLGFVYLGCVLVLMLVLIKNGVQSMFFIVILIIAALGFGAGVGILAGWVAIIATIIMIGLLYSFKQYG
jgi:hypothetical protein